jgi:acetyltransferase-like isoleucine patch superfamily enzyme
MSVNSDLEAYTIYQGNPAKEIRKRVISLITVCYNATGITATAVAISKF